MSSAAGDLDLEPFERHIDQCELCRRQIAGLVRANRDSAPQLAREISDGVSIGRYLITAPSGAGAMGQVFEAQDPDLGRAIAIKIVHHRDAMADARALREGRALARLAHPNVVAVYDVGIWSGGVFLAMELVRGTTVRSWSESPRPWRDVVRVYATVARGLHAAHSAGLVHRDVKPDNLVLGDDGRVRVIDFGLAADDTADAAMAGTPAYMAPEQAERADARSDQYAFMVSLFETLEGKRPDKAPVFARTPGWLRAVIRRGLRTAPSERHPNMAVVARHLERGLGRRARVAFIVGAAAIVAGVAAIALRHPAVAGPSCDGRPRLAGVWDPARKHGIESALLATAKPYAAATWRSIEGALDRYADGWVAMHAEACAATHERGEQSGELLDLRMQCLGDRLQDLRSLGDVLARSGPDTVASALKAAVALRPLERCSDAVALRALAPLPVDPAARAKLDQTKITLSEASARIEAGDAKGGGAIASGLPAIGYAPLDAERLLLIGRSKRTTGDYDAALGALRGAVREADAGGADAVRVDALVELIDVVGVRKGEHDQALEIAKDADALVDRMGKPLLARARLARARGVVLGRKGSAAEAIDELGRALAAFEQALGPEDLQVATTSNMLGNALFRASRIDEAVVAYRRTLAIRAKILGETHPDTAGVLANLGAVLLNRHDFTGAEAAYRCSMQIVTATLGANHPDVALYHVNIGLSLVQQQRFADALPEWDAATASYAARYANTYHPEYVQSLTGRAQTLLGLGRAAEAVTVVDEAYRLSLLRPGDVDAANLADTRFTLARAQWETNRDRKGALAHATWARDLWAKRGALKTDELAEAELWLASHR